MCHLFITLVVVLVLRMVVRESARIGSVFSFELFFIDSRMVNFNCR